jgi:TolB-like protein/Tfp pilus assembly protein PilF
MHRLLMRLYTDRGQRAQALRQYQLCRDNLRRDLGVKPDEATERLLKDIQTATDGIAVRLERGQFGAVAPVPQLPRSAESVPDSLGKRAKERTIEPRRWVAAAAIIAVLIVADGVSWLLPRQPEIGTALPPPEEPSIAVLAFNDLGTDPNWKGLPDALTENVVDDLSRSRDLFVIARNSTEIYKGKTRDARQIGRELGVKYVLDGTTQTSEDQVRITAQLIETATGRQVWSGRYDRSLKNIFNIFTVQDDVTQKITGTLTGWEGVVAEADRRILRRKRPSSLQAHDYYLLGVEYKNRMTKADNIKAQELFRKAIKLDPGFARAYVGLATTYEHEIDIGYTESPSRSLDAHLGLIQKALDLDPLDGLAHMTFGMSFLFRNDFDRAASEFERAVSLCPNDADVLVLYGGNLAWLGNPQLGLEMAEAAVRRNPNFPMWYNYNLRNAYFFVGNFEAALAAARRIENPAVHDYAFLAAINAELDRASEAKAAAAEALRLVPAWSVELFINDTGAFKRDEEMNLFLDGARKSGLPICALPNDLQKRPDVKRLALCRHVRQQN